MFIVLGVLAVLLAAGIAVYAFWDEFVPPATTPPALRGSPTRLQDQRVPGFSLPGLVGQGFEARDLLTRRKPIVVKFWGTWSPACILEYPVLMDLQASRVEMWALPSATAGRTRWTTWSATATPMPASPMMWRGAWRRTGG